MPRRSAGILLHKRRGDTFLVMLVHPGGPFWRNRDDGAWSIPKGECQPDEPAELAARREFAEEIGRLPPGPVVALGGVRQRGGKQVEAFALEGDFDARRIVGGSFEMEWPPGSGKRQAFPEVDRAAWLSLEEARRKINAGQLPFIDRLEKMRSDMKKGGP
jgi:predicted NUDIX family NTP pyrophosphohydrolase